tara:strand:+ start:262 stop:483 length:222 start_codon:yes stop_codon:yes gene_type:complete
MPRTTLPQIQSNSEKLNKANISLQFLQKEVKKLTDEQKAIRLMLLEVLENTRPYALLEKPEPEPEPEKWRWWG